MLQGLRASLDCSSIITYHHLSQTLHVWHMYLQAGVVPGGSVWGGSPTGRVWVSPTHRPDATWSSASPPPSRPADDEFGAGSRSARGSLRASAQGQTAHAIRAGQKRARSVQRRRPSRCSQWGSHAIETAKFVEVCAAARLRRCCGGGPAPELRELVAGICLSVLSDAKQVEDLLAQEWVDSWQGWTELQANGSDSVAVAVAERFLRIAGANVPVRMASNRERLRQLEEEGLDLKIASSHGVNNCLIDSLLLGLTLRGIVPQKYSVGERAAVRAMCRENLLHAHGTPLGVYLDGHRDTPRILSFFFRELWAAEIAIRVYFYDCLDQAALGGAAAELAYVDFTWGAPPSDRQHTLYVYNHNQSY